MKSASWRSNALLIMRAQDLVSVIEQACEQLQSLRARLAHEGASPGSEENQSVLAELLETLETMRVRCGSENEARIAEAELHRNRLRTLASQIVIDEEQSRQALAANLHSGLAHDIALAKMELATLPTALSADHPAALARIESLVKQADGSLRTITYQLCPPSLHDLGLVPALEWLAEDLSDRYGLDVRIVDAGIPALANKQLRIILFRTVRALLIQAATHAGATDVLVWLGPEEGSLRINISDNGETLESTGVRPEGLGLFGVRELMRHVGGNLHIDSVPGKGTTVALLSPLAIAQK